LAPEALYRLSFADGLSPLINAVDAGTIRNGHFQYLPGDPETVHRGIVA
jgi:hypothetical protein